jgi:hypothetical protein
MLKRCAANRNRSLSALPDIYTTLKSLALQGDPYIYDISRLRVKAAISDIGRSRTVRVTGMAYLPSGERVRRLMIIKSI